MSFGLVFPDVRGETLPSAQERAKSAGVGGSRAYTHTHAHTHTRTRTHTRAHAHARTPSHQTYGSFQGGDVAKRQNVIIRGHNTDISFSLPVPNAARQSVNSHSGARKLPKFGIF